MKSNFEKKYISEAKSAEKDFLMAKKQFEKEKKKYGDFLEEFVRTNIHHTQEMLKVDYVSVIHSEIDSQMDLICSSPFQYFDPYLIYDSMIQSHIYLIANEEIPDIKFKNK